MSDGPIPISHHALPGVTEIRFRREITPEPGVQWGCEQCCYYFLQVIFIACILVGFALAVVGGILHGQNHNEFVVFVYIGILLGGVSTLLLSIQCYVRRSNKKRQRIIQRHVINNCTPSSDDNMITVPLTVLSNPQCSHGTCSSVTYFDVARTNEQPLIYQWRPHSLPRSEYHGSDLIPPRYNELWSSKYPTSRWQQEENIV